MNNNFLFLTFEFLVVAWWAYDLWPWCDTSFLISYFDRTWMYVWDMRAYDGRWHPDLRGEGGGRFWSGIYRSVSIEIVRTMIIHSDAAIRFGRVQRTLCLNLEPDLWFGSSRLLNLELDLEEPGSVRGSRSLSSAYVANSMRFSLESLSSSWDSKNAMMIATAMRGLQIFISSNRCISEGLTRIINRLQFDPKYELASMIDQSSASYSACHFTDTLNLAWRKKFDESWEYFYRCKSMKRMHLTSKPHLFVPIGMFSHAFHFSEGESNKNKVNLAPSKDSQ